MVENTEPIWVYHGLEDIIMEDNAYVLNLVNINTNITANTRNMRVAVPLLS